MTASPGAPAPEPTGTPKPTSDRVFRRTLGWSAVVTVALAVLGAVVGWFVADMPGMVSALSGIILAAVFLAMTALTILIANRWYGDALYIPIFFGGVLGGWLLKLVLFFIVMAILKDQEWMMPMIFFIAVVVAIMFTLVIDVVVMLRTRLPYVSDAVLPTPPAEEPGAATERGVDS